MTRFIFGLPLASVTFAAAIVTQEVQGVVGPYAVRIHELNVGSQSVRLTVRGSSLSDIDCWVYDSADRILAFATDDSSDCVLDVPGGGRRMVWIVNLGGRTNRYRLRQVIRVTVRAKSPT